MYNLINVLDFFIENKTKYDHGDYKNLKELHLKLNDSDFIQDCIVLTLYNYVKPLKMPFNTFILNKDVLSFLQNYENDYSSLLEKNKDNLNKLEEFLFKDVQFVKNPLDLIPYLIIEALVEYHNADIRFLKSSVKDDTEESTMVYDDFVDLKEHNIVEAFQNKPYGYYITANLPEKYSSYYKGTRYNIVSNQGNGLTIFNLDNTFLETCGFRSDSINFSHLVNKEHLITFDAIKSEKTDLSTTVNINKYFKSFINQLIFKTFSFFANANKSDHKEEVLIGYKKETSKNTNFPIVTIFEKEDMPVFTFDELAFTGKYQCLAFLDTYFKNIVDLDLINYYSDELFSTHLISHSSNSYTPTDKSYSFSKKYFNDFEIEIEHMQSYLPSRDSSNGCLTPINPHFVGSKQEIRDYAFRIAKANKIKLYSYYLGMFLREHSEKFTNDISNFLHLNIEDLLDNNELLNSIVKIGTANASSRNWEYISGSHSNISFLNKASVFDKNGYLNSLKNINILDYKGKSKGTKLVAFDCRNTDFSNILKNDYNLKLDNTSNFFLLWFEAKHELEKIAESENRKMHGSLFRFIDNGADPELYNWFYNSPFIHIIVPMSKSNEEKFITKAKTYEHIEFINCNFGYSNGSRGYS
jgi:hypothetical protein